MTAVGDTKLYDCCEWGKQCGGAFECSFFIHIVYSSKTALLGVMPCIDQLSGLAVRVRIEIERFE